MPPPPILDPAQLDLTTIYADREAIRKVNRHRFEMEQLDAICMLDPVQQLVVGYRDVRHDEFWVRGHFPEVALFPGVLMCEAAAQMGSFYTISLKVFPNNMVGFGGMDEVRFRAPVRPGDRLVLVGRAIRLRRIQSVFTVQGFVGTHMVFHGNLIAVSIGKIEGS